MNKTENKWSTAKCGRCNQAHTGYTGKLDASQVEYVVCGLTNKRMNVSGTGPEGNSFAFGTVWTKEKAE